MNVDSWMYKLQSRILFNWPEKRLEKGTAMTSKTYKTRAYEGYDFTVTANDTATITKVSATKWGTFYDVHTAHNGNFNVHEDVLPLIICTD